MTDNMIERVARAMAATMIEYKISPPTNSPDYAIRALARAAIAAMREPTEQVRNTMNAHASNGMVNWDDYHAAMIDAALKEKA